MNRERKSWWWKSSENLKKTKESDIEPASGQVGGACARMAPVYLCARKTQTVCYGGAPVAEMPLWEAAKVEHVEELGRWWAIQPNGVNLRTLALKNLGLEVNGSNSRTLHMTM